MCKKLGDWLLESHCMSFSLMIYHEPKLGG